MPTLQLHLFGTLDIRRDDQSLDKPPTLKSQSLLAYLALHRQHPQPRERLASLFWGDRPERKARSSLSTSLWHIRRCLPDEEFLITDPHTVQLDPHADLWLDVDEFESHVSRDDVASLRSAVALYRGDFLDGFYDDWIVDERYRLEGLFAEALARLMVGQEAAGERSAALSTALRLLARDPLREDAHRVAMRTYCRLGQRNAALEQFGRCQEILQQELGTEPMAETVELHQAILEGRFEIGRVTETLPVTMVPVAAGRNPLDVIAASPLVGREEEMAFLQGCWQEVSAGSGRLILVSGEAGVGKTRLAETFADQVRWRGARVLWGRCYELERALPYQPIAEAVRAVLPTLPATELTELPAWAIAEVARLVPEIAEHHPDLTAPTSIQPDQEQARLFNGVARFLTELSAGGALLVVLEDLHWASESTLQLIHYLARHLADQPVLMVGTLRPEEIGPEHPLMALQRQLKREELCQPLHLDRLSSEAVAAMVQEMSGAGEAVLPLAQQLYQETEGNPFFLIEIIKALFETEVVRLEKRIWQGDFAQLSRGEMPLPVGVSEAVQSRARRLGKETQKALRLAAVLGHEFDFALLHEVWGQGEEATLEALDGLLRHRLIDEGTGTLERDYAFTHHKIQEIVYADIPRRQRQRLHAQAGTAMERLYEPHLVIPELAFHFERAQRVDKQLTEKAITYLRRAGEQAAAQYANTEAASYFGRALDLLPRDDTLQWIDERYSLLLAREKINTTQGDREARVQDLESLKELTEHLTVQQQAEVALRQAKCAYETSGYATAIVVARTAINLAQTLQEADTAAEGHLIWGQALTRQGKTNLARSQCERALALAHKAQSHKLEADCLNNLGIITYGMGDYAVARAYYEQALQIFDRIKDRRGQSATLNNLGVVCNEQGDNAAAKACYEQALGIHRETGNRRGECLVLGNIGEVAAALGKYVQATLYHERSLAIACEIGNQYFEANALINLGNDHARLGEYEDAKDVYESSLHTCRQINYRAGEAWTLVGLSLLSHHLGDDESALNHGEQAQCILREASNPLIQGYASTCLGHALSGLNRLPEAIDAYRWALDLRREMGQANLTAETLAGLAQAYLAQGDPSRAQVYVEEILAHLETGTLAGSSEPLQVYLTCYRVLCANRDSRAGAILAKAHEFLQVRAREIADERLYRSFLENVTVNREIVAATTDGSG